MNSFFSFRKSASMSFVASALILTACAKKEVPAETHIVAVAPKMTVDEFIGEANKKLDVATLENNTAQWVYESFITDDSALISAKSSEQFLTTQ